MRKKAFVSCKALKHSKASVLIFPRECSVMFYTHMVAKTTLSYDLAVLQLGSPTESGLHPFLGTWKSGVLAFFHVQRLPPPWLLPPPLLKPSALHISL